MNTTITIRHRRRGAFRVLADGAPNPRYLQPPVALPALPPRGGGRKARWRRIDEFENSLGVAFGDSSEPDPSG